jgi:LPS sulfotransferase NodH
VRRFVILFPGRVGSTYLVSALAEHPEVVADGERLSGLRPRGAEAQLAWARTFLRGPVVGRARARGFKTKLRDVQDPQGFADLVGDLDVRVLLMSRRNDVKHAVSRVTAKDLHEATGRWNRYDEAGAAPAPVHVDLERFHRLLDGVIADKAEIADYVRSLDRPTLEVEYEQLLAGPTAVFAQVQEFLGVRPRDLRGATVKNTSDDLRDVVANFDELRASVTGDEQRAMFDE